MKRNKAFDTAFLGKFPQFEGIRMHPAERRILLKKTGGSTAIMNKIVDLLRFLKKMRAETRIPRINQFLFFPLEEEMISQ
jgi:hypothetical protein